MNKKSIGLFAAFVFIFEFSCLRLDSFLFSPITDITTYQLENFIDNEHFRLDSTYDIDAALVSAPFTITSSDENGNQVDIYAVYIGDQSLIGTDKVILYCHGNSAHMDYYWQRAKLMANAGTKNKYGVLMFDYQGYGLSGGTPSEANLYRDADAAMAWLSSKGLTGSRLIIYGYSMGSAPATELTANARTLQPALLILESPFASAAIMVQDGSGLALPGSFFTSLQIDNAEEIRNITEPFLWLHGVDDNFVNIGHGEIVYANYGGTVSEAVRVDGAGHGNVPEIMGFSSYLSKIDTFITTNVP